MHMIVSKGVGVVVAVAVADLFFVTERKRGREDNGGGFPNITSFDAAPLANHLGGLCLEMPLPG